MATKLNIESILRRLIAIRGFSQVYVAEQLGVSRANLWNKITGDRPTVDTIFNIAEVVGYDIVFVPKSGQGKGLPRYVVRSDEE